MNQLPKIITEDLRDSIINSYLDIETGSSAINKDLHEVLKTLSNEQKEAIFNTVLHSVDSGIHDFLFKLQELHEDGHETGLYENGINIASESDGLHGELLTEDGWFHKYSQHKSN